MCSDKRYSGVFRVRQSLLPSVVARAVERFFCFSFDSFSVTLTGIPVDPAYFCRRWQALLVKNEVLLLCILKR